MTKIRQIAYFVPDVRAAATWHRARFGSGPFLVADHIALSMCLHHGRLAELDHSAAYGQWGDVMIEFVQQNNDGASAFHDLYPRGGGGQGLHHVAIFVDDIGQAIAEHERDGNAVALYAETPSGLVFAMIDMVATLGHMVEVYQPDPVLVDFYAAVAREPPGAAPWRTISFD